MLLLVVAITSCNQEPTLQSYYVANESNKQFTIVDVPRSLVNTEGITLQQEQKQALNSINKLNILAFDINRSNSNTYQTELAKVKTILANNKYEELMRGSIEGGKFVIKFLGELNKIDELIIFGSTEDKGFLIARVLGNNMNAKNILSLKDVLEQANFEKGGLENITNFFK